MELHDIKLYDVLQAEDWAHRPGDYNMRPGDARKELRKATVKYKRQILYFNREHMKDNYLQTLYNFSGLNDLYRERLLGDIIRDGNRHINKMASDPDYARQFPGEEQSAVLEQKKADDAKPIYFSM